MDRVRLGDVLSVLLLAIILLGNLASALPRRRLLIPGDPRTQDFDSDDGQEEEDVPVRLPDDISVTEYYIKIQPYYPAPGIHLDEGRNMTFDGSVAMSVKIKRPTSEIVLNAANLKISSVELTDFLKRPVGIKETRLNNKTEQLSILLQRQPRVGSVFVLTIKFTGKINPFDAAGLYYTSYQDSEGEVHWMVATQLAVFSARTVFPCMDEPAFKAIFHVELVYPSSHVALGNMKETTPVDLGNGWSQVSFPATPVMSTYLVAFSSGPYVSHSVINKDGTLVRSWGWRGQENFLKFSAETAGECLYQMGLYTNIKFPMEKCDHLGLPEFLAGAMENFGLIVYKYQFIAFNPDTMTTLDKIGAALVICHEVSHQEAATVRTDREKAMARDASAYTHPLIAVNGPYFDPITYEKGQMVLRMLADVIGEDVLQSGLQNYLQTHKYSTASHWDVWSGLTEICEDEGIPGWHGFLNVTELMEPYSLQSSYPVINVHAGKTGITFSQERFNDISTQSPSPWNYTWIIPLRTAGVIYDDNSLRALLKKIATDDVPVGVKIALIGDEVAIVKRNKSMKLPYSYDRLLDILATVLNTASKEDPSSQLVDIALPQMEFFASLLRDSIDAPLVERLFRRIFGKVYKSEIWDAASTWNAGQNRDAVDLKIYSSTMKNVFLPHAVRYNIGDSASKAQKYFSEISENCKLAESNNGSAWCNKVPNDIHRAVYCGAAKYDNNLGANFARLMFLYNGEVKTNPYYYQEYSALLEGMACTQRAPQLKTLIRLLLTSRHRPSLIFGWLKKNPEASEALYLYLKTKSDSVLQYAGLSYYLDAMVYNWRSERRLRQFNELCNTLLPKMNDKQKRAFDTFEKRIKDNIEWSKQHLPSILRWMYDELVVVGKAPWSKRSAYPLL
ncbi:peptidase family M1 [Ancylostoma caninum]|uniref:Aminopeptidase n=1 Tax=Ancylostoma caninum TaxID=29170 RepID=A0A368FN30_ANCCA|nr:peptidase family M1 [Ancylostoma caninum]